MYSGVEYVVCCYSECISHTRQAEKSAWPRWEYEPATFGLLVQCSTHEYDNIVEVVDMFEIIEPINRSSLLSID